MRAIYIYANDLRAYLCIISYIYIYEKHANRTNLQAQF